jgi:hypothetical protein
MQFVFSLVKAEALYDTIKSQWEVSRNNNFGVASQTESEKHKKVVFEEGGESEEEVAAGEIDVSKKDLKLVLPNLLNGTFFISLCFIYLFIWFYHVFSKISQGPFNIKVH